MSAPDSLNLAAVRIQAATKTLGGNQILADFDLDVRRGEFFSLLGPSGSGKSTILNVVAGFTPLDAGTVTLHGREVTDEAPYRRNIGFIFQEYALFPHMSVGQNVRFPLDMRRLKRREADAKVAEALEVVGLAHLADRRPQALSGGQRQRVAIARAMVFRPDVLLMDEPMSSLDRQLRDEMTVETRRLQQDLGITVIYVTHDQTEALSLSDRIGILRHGKIEQVGSPEEVHGSPASLYSAQLCGPINVETVESTQVEANIDGEKAIVRLPDTQILSRAAAQGVSAEYLGVRPYLMRLQQEATAPGLNVRRVTVLDIGLVGNGVRYDVSTPGGAKWHVLAGERFQGIGIGDEVHAVWSPDNTSLLGL